MPGSVLSGSLNDGASVITVLGPAINVSTEGGVFVGGAQVTKADVEASNGVIHVIDRVLLPTI